VAHLEQRVDPRAVVGLIRTSLFDRHHIADREQVELAKTRLGEYLEQKHPDMMPVAISVCWDQEHGSWSIEVKPQSRFRARRSVVDWALIESSEYQEALDTERDLRSIGDPPYLLRSGETETRVADTEALMVELERRARKGVNVSRYKGLGEMNAEELWETTMNPDGRVLRQVRVDDALSTDELFSILMGDQVEPRRLFIEQHALLAQNLDI
jgi:DNA gyrase subunit B